MKVSQVGFSEAAIRHAYSLLQAAVDNGQLMGAVLQVARGGTALPVAYFGKRQQTADGADVTADTIFLIASITKPIVCAAVIKLLEQGRLSLNDRAADIVPEFGNRDKEDITLRHLLTHTSGLPDMVPENHALRTAHQPLSEFVKRIYELDLLFTPGTRISYQSCGIAILGEIVERLEGRPLPDVLRTHFFDPLGLNDTSLGRQENLEERESEIRLPQTSDGGGAGTDWHWNSVYWRRFCAPWGGMLTTAADLTVLCQTFLYGGEANDTRILSKAAVAVMTRDQTSSMGTLPESEKHHQRWGLGWRLSDGALYGDLTSPDTFGHGGATGTIAWADPQTEVTFVLLTNDPLGAARLRSVVSNAVAAAVL